MEKRINTLCRLAGRVCTECCESRDCLSFGELADETWGCLGYFLLKNTQMDTPDGKRMVHPPRKICKQVDCLEELSSQQRQLVESEILKLPVGQFYMSVLLRKLKSGILSIS